MPRSPRAIIWDMDGVIVDTAPFHFRAWQRVAGDMGVSFTRSDFDETFGKRNPDIIREKISSNLSEEEVNVLGQRKERIFREIADEKVKPFPGSIRLLQAASQAGWSMAVASSTPLENIRMILDSLRITAFFDAIVSDRDVSRGKPDPEGFLLAARKLGAAPRLCIVIEDAVAGVEAARAAKMKCIAVTNTRPAEWLARADLVTDSLEKVNLAALEGLLEVPTF